jgi:predicted acyltransferase
MEKSPGRLVSLDAFRGATIAAMILVNNPGSWSHIYRQLDHAEWNGWTLTDLIFPFFLFITGVATVFSRSSATLPSRSRAYLKIVRRSAILFLLGLLLNGFPSYTLSTIRAMGVLQRIAVCYGVVAVVQLETGIGVQIAFAVVLLLGYWALMAFAPVPGIGTGVLEKGRNFAAYVDSFVLKNHIWSQTRTWDPEGIVSTLPAIATTLFGALTGSWIKSGRSDEHKALGMAVAGIGGLALGSFWNIVLPINKNLWTSSYAVFMSGFALVILSACYYLSEVKKIVRWTYPFVVFGKNSILVFVLSGFVARLIVLLKITVNGHALAVKTWLYETLFASWLTPAVNASLGYALAFVFIFYLLMLALYKKRIFIKI